MNGMMNKKRFYFNKLQVGEENGATLDPDLYSTFLSSRPEVRTLKFHKSFIKVSLTLIAVSHSTLYRVNKNNRYTIFLPTNIKLIV